MLHRLPGALRLDTLSHGCRPSMVTSRSLPSDGTIGGVIHRLQSGEADSEFNPINRLAKASPRDDQGAYLDTHLRWPLSSPFPPLAGNSPE